MGLPALSAGEPPAKTIPIRRIPRKRIPKTVRYRHAPAFSARQKKNRKLVADALRQRRRLKRTGTAYEKDYR